MIFQNQFLAVAGVALVALQLSTVASRASDPSQRFAPTGPAELINQPVCWSAEEPDPSRHCDFAQKS
jgi:hypothetical protein